MFDSIQNIAAYLLCMLAEITQAQHLLALLVVADKTKAMMITGIQNFRTGITENGMLPADVQHCFQAIEDFSLAGFIKAGRRFILIHHIFNMRISNRYTVYPAVIMTLRRIVAVAVVVQ